MRRTLTNPAAHAQRVNLSPSVTNRTRVPSLRGDRGCEIAPATAEGEHPQVVALERPVLDERQEPVFGAPMIEPVHHVEDSHGMPSGGKPRLPQGMPRPLESLVEGRTTETGASTEPGWPAAPI